MLLTWSWLRNIFLFLMFFFFNDTATTEIYTLSLHDALPISPTAPRWALGTRSGTAAVTAAKARSEEHTSELQSRQYIVCRLLLEKKKTPVSRPDRPTRRRPCLRPARSHRGF